MDTNELTRSRPEAPWPRFPIRAPSRAEAILTPAVCAMLSGARSRYAIYQWGRQQDRDTVAVRGFTRATIILGASPIRFSI